MNGKILMVLVMLIVASLGLSLYAILELQTKQPSTTTPKNVQITGLYYGFDGQRFNLTNVSPNYYDLVHVLIKYVTLNETSESTIEDFQPNETREFSLFENNGLTLGQAQTVEIFVSYETFGDLIGGQTFNLPQIMYNLQVLSYTNVTAIQQEQNLFKDAFFLATVKNNNTVPLFVNSKIVSINIFSPTRKTPLDPNEEALINFTSPIAIVYEDEGERLGFYSLNYTLPLGGYARPFEYP
jgi:hypothetical protein